MLRRPKHAPSSNKRGPGRNEKHGRTRANTQSSDAAQHQRASFRYLATCPSGLEDLVASCLSQDDLPGLHIDHIEDGVVLFRSSADFKRLIALKYINVLFGILAQLNRVGSASEAVRRIGRDEKAMARTAALVTPKERTFRLSVSNEGTLTKGGPDKGLLVSRLAEATRLKHSSHRPDSEFWIMRRRSGLCLFAKRLSRRAGTEKTLQKGELRPEIAHLLCRLSEPDASDVFVDPFAGSGALPLARITYPFELVFALDAEADKIQSLKQKIKEAQRRRKKSVVIAARANATNLEKRFDDGFVSKIVTDPPWGQFDTTIVDLPEFYHQIFCEALRILRDNGALVMLMGDRKLADRMTHRFADKISLDARYETLVNGKPAVICKWRRIPRTTSMNDSR